MNNLKVGTITMIRYPTGFQPVNGAVPNGAIGEVVSGGDLKHLLKVDEVAWESSRYPANKYVSWWRTPKSWLIPLSDPDIDIGVDEEIKKPVEDLV
jgi:hypothetical protein